MAYKSTIMAIKNYKTIVVNGNNVPALVTKQELADTTTDGASLVGIQDSGGYYASTTVEAALQEVGSGGVSLDKIKLDITNTTAPIEGEINWNSEDGTAQIGMPGGNVILQIGQELTFKMKNVGGSDVINGTAVFVFGSTGANQTFKKAQANAIATAMCTIGLTTEDISDNGFGYVTTNGYVRDMDTDHLTEGAPVYLSATDAGKLTATKPTTPNYVWKVGNCMKKHATEGIIFVNITRERNRFGDDTNYSEFEPDGTYKANGGATVFEDLNFDPASSGGPTVTVPDYVTINNVIHREFTSGNNQLCGDGEEVPHKYKLGTLMYPHAHGFLKAGESSGTTGVTFTLYWELRQTTGTTSGSTTLTKTSAELAANGNKIDFYNGSFDGPTELGAQLTLTLARTAGNAGDVIITTYGVHYEIDMLGSHTLTTK